MLAPAAGAAAGLRAKEFRVGGRPFALAAGPDGSVWFNEGAVGRIGKITPSGKVTEYASGISGIPSAHGITAGPDGNVWFAEYITGGAPVSALAKVTPAGVVTEYRVSQSQLPEDTISAGPDGNLWYGSRSQPVCLPTGPASCTIQQFRQLCKMTVLGAVTCYRDSAPDVFASVETPGPDGNVWFIQGGGIPEQESVGKISSSGVVTEYPLGGTLGRALDITAGPDGNLWFTQNLAKRICKMSPTGSSTCYSAGPHSPHDIAAGPDGNLWFTEDFGGNRIGRITTDGKVAHFDLTGAPIDIVAGPDGNLWVSEFGPSRIVRLTLPGGSQLLPGVTVPRAATVRGASVRVGTAANPPIKSLTVSVKDGRTLVGKETLSVPTGANMTVTVTLSHSATAALRRRGKLEVRVTVTARLAVGTTKTASRSVTLHR